MSHFSKVKTQINDIQILKTVLEKFDYVFEEDPNHSGSIKIIGYAGQVHSADLVVKTDNPDYTIGFEKQKDGNYSVVADWYGIKSIQNKKINETTFKQNIIKHYGFEKVKASLPPHLKIIESKGEKNQEVLTLKLKRIY
jgi:hypothetical protein